MNAKTSIVIFSCMAFNAISFLCTAQFPDALATELQEILDFQVETMGNNGCAASVILPNGDTWHGEAGADGDGDPITAETVFQAASCSKTHVAVCLLLMEEDGLLDLDDPWSEYVSFDVDFDPNITLRQLVGNRSGIADYLEITGAGALITEDMTHFWTPTELLEDVISQTPDFPADTDFHYSTSNFVLAGQVIEAVSGNALYDEMRTRIWEPLGLEHTYGGAYDDFTEPLAGVWWNFGDGFQNYSAADPTSMLSFGYAGAGLVSNPVDQAIFIHELLGGDLVSPEHLVEMHDFSPESYDDWSAGYGLGIHHAINVGSDQVIGVDGYYTNMSSTFHNENDGFSVSTMTNTLGAWYGIFNPIHDAVRDYLETSVEATYMPSIWIYPNPVTDMLQIENAPIGSVLEIFDLCGRVTMQEFVTTTNQQIQLQNLSQGIYQMRVLDARGRTRHQEKFLKVN
jgi:D-alanyl-D-alanine carboxypeptidase